MTPTDNSVQPPRLGHYEILEKIAKGGMGSVYKGRYCVSGERVAIKIATPEVAAKPVLVERFRQEYRTASALSHPHLVRALDFGVERDKLYLVMEFVDGPSLGQRIRHEGRLPEAEAVGILVQVAQALAFIHRHNIIHRDVKPNNILLTPSGQAKLTDLGLVKDRLANLDLTNPLRGLGTANFIAPEQFTDAIRADVRNDIYSLGATLYMAVTGKLPFSSKTKLAILKRKMQDAIIPPKQIVPTLSERVDAAIRRAMLADVSQRFSSCTQIIAALTGKRRRANGIQDIRRKKSSTTTKDDLSKPRERRVSVGWSSRLLPPSSRPGA